MLDWWRSGTFGGDFWAFLFSGFLREGLWDKFGWSFWVISLVILARVANVYN